MEDVYYTIVLTNGRSFDVNETDLVKILKFSGFIKNFKTFRDLIKGKSFLEICDIWVALGGDNIREIVRTK
jgi:hypothetical protein